MTDHTHEIQWSEPPSDTRYRKYPVSQWVERRCFGETLESIGDEYGLSRERIRQLTEEHAPHKPWQAIKREQKRLREEVRRVRRTTPIAQCNTCGDDVFPPKKVYCCEECREIQMALRFACDEEEWKRHRKAVSRYHVENAEKYSKYQIRSAKRILADADDLEQHGRWFIEGSQVFEYALEAAKKDWPIFDRMHPDLQKQITTVIRNRDKKENP